VLGAAIALASIAASTINPEAPTVSGFWHWAVVNIPGTVTQLPGGCRRWSRLGVRAGRLSASERRSDGALLRRRAPPGHGRHRYIFAVLALAIEKIEIDPGAMPAWLMFSLFNGTLRRAFLEGWLAMSVLPPCAQCCRWFPSIRKC